MDWSRGKATVHMRTSLTHLDTVWNMSTHLDATRLLPFCFDPALNVVTGWAIDLPALLIGVYWGHRWLCHVCVIVCVLCIVCRYVIRCVQLVPWLQVSGLTKSLLLNCGGPPLCRASIIIKLIIYNHFDLSIYLCSSFHIHIYIYTFTFSYIYI